MFTHTTGDIDGLRRDLEAFRVTLLTGPVSVPDYDGRVMLAAGPNDELFEIIEADGRGR